MGTSATNRASKTPEAHDSEASLGAVEGRAKSLIRVVAAGLRARHACRSNPRSHSVANTCGASLDEPPRKTRPARPTVDPGGAPRRGLARPRPVLLEEVKGRPYAETTGPRVWRFRPGSVNIGSRNLRLLRGCSGAPLL